ncbi:MAG: hypothetical protein E7222_12920 [Clostridiales bacterium]|nr:hypothetical protein [Clostridiales bacterium]
MKSIKRQKRQLAAIMLVLVMVVSLFANAGTSHAGSGKTITTRNSKVVCGTTATVKNMTGKGFTYKSSNKKVATISKTGKIKALRLGVTKITIKNPKKSTQFQLTVIPKNKSDLRLNHSILLKDQNTTLKLVSEKYDTSQIKPVFYGSFKELSKNGTWKARWEGDYEEGCGSVRIRYGDYDLYETIFNVSAEYLAISLEEKIKPNKPFDGKVKIGGYKLSLEDFAKSGVRLTFDDKAFVKNQVMKPGEYRLSVSADNVSATESMYIKLKIRDVFKYRNTAGYPKDKKEVLDAVFAAVDQVVTPGMSDREKVKAIHDYLIYHANYYINGYYWFNPGWAYAAKGVLLNKGGVCNSYALAFCMLAEAAGLECRYVSGDVTTSNDGHAWNRVSVDGTWYYVDCTWDDNDWYYVDGTWDDGGDDGGSAKYDYYLATSLWPDHLNPCEEDIMDAGDGMWMEYYLCGDGYLELKYY